MAAAGQVVRRRRGRPNTSTGRDAPDIHIAVSKEAYDCIAHEAIRTGKSVQRVARELLIWVAPRISLVADCEKGRIGPEMPYSMAGK